MRALELVRSRRFDAVWATSDPLTPLAVAEEAAAMARVPWVADIRDCFNVQAMGSWHKRPFFARQERRLCRQADYVFAVSQGLAEGLGQRTGRKVHVLHNGFDPALIPPRPTDNQPSKFTLLYAGHLVLPQRNPAAVFKALELCLASGNIDRDRIEVVFRGSNPALVNEASPGVTERLPVRVLPGVSHHDALKEQLKASALLLLTHAGEKGVLTGKVFDYLAAGRPILAVPDDRAEVASLLQRTGAGLSCSGAEAIAAQLQQWYHAWEQDPNFNLNRNEAEIAKYSRREQTRHLAGVLDELVTSPCNGGSAE
jgi:glycosyltransferase involved in cell wall biosynthesis